MPQHARECPNGAASVTDDQPAAAGPAASSRTLPWRAALAGQLILLAAQFVLGMAVNLFARVPAVHPGSVRPGSDYFTSLARAVSWALTSGDVLLRLHVIAGLLAVAAGIVLVLAAMWAGGRRRAVAAWSGLAFVVGAGFNGGSFLIFGDGDKLASFLMASLFLLAVVVYTVALPLEARGSGAAAPTGGVTADWQADEDTAAVVPEAPADPGDGG